MRKRILSSPTLRAAFFGLSLFVLCASLGCEALGKKFIRHPKGEEKLGEPVLVPQEYPSLFKNSTEAYRQYLFYWKSWQDELLNAISNHSSAKKKSTCAAEAIKNLTFMKNLLKEDQQKGLDGYIQDLASFKAELEKDRFASNEALERMKAEAIRRNILRDYSLEKMKGNFKDDTGTN